MLELRALARYADSRAARDPEFDSLELPISFNPPGGR